MPQQNSRTPLGLCAICFTRKELTHRWAWLKLCAECAAKHGAAQPLSSGEGDPASDPPQDPPDSSGTR